MGLLSEFERLINERGSAAILRERLSLFKDKIANLEKENSDLKRNLHKAQEDVQRHHAQLKNQTVADQFVEHEGMLFKRKAGGGYHSAVYCPSCKMVMSTIDAGIPLNCSKCEIIAPWRPHDLPRVIKELPE
jgi:hypothetical protein